MLILIVYGVIVYLAAGVVFGIFFLVFRVARVDAGADGSSIWFKLIILPGLAVLWPIMLLRWLRGAESPPIERTAHRVLTGSDGGSA